jgi:hypothetical protein
MSLDDTPARLRRRSGTRIDHQPRRVDLGLQLEQCSARDQPLPLTSSRGAILSRIGPKAVHEAVEVGPTLRNTAPVARLIFGAHHHMRAVLALGAAVKVAPPLTG